MSRPSFSIQAYSTALALAVCVSFVYFPGLNGGFQFDDFPNLSVLGDFGGVTSKETLYAYVKSAIASELGRPIAMLSFLANAQTWPADAKPFLITNIGFHVANTLLLGIIVFIILRNARSPQLSRNALGIAGFSALFWGCHPFLVSTTLYIVQRMAILSAFFCLAALLLYLIWRIRILSRPEQRPIAAALVAAGIGMLTLLSSLSKENGALTPLLILVVEFFIIAPLWTRPEESPWLRRWLFIVLIVPMIIVFVLLLYKMGQTGLFTTVGNRPFTGLERLLAQPLILLYYLFCLLIPQPGYSGLFYDGHPLQLANPEDILPWVGVLGIALLLLLAFRFRRDYPLATAGFVFFIAGHSMESLVVSLEPMFEHRNYLPSSFLFLPIVAAIFRLRRKAIKTAALLGIGSILCAFTFSRAALWGEPKSLAIYWAINNPHSVRAQVVAADTLLKSARFKQALFLLDQAEKNNPKSAPILATRFIAEQRLGIPAESTRKRALEAFRTGEFGTHIPRITDTFVENYQELGAEVMPPDFVLRALDIFIERPDYQHRVYQTNLRSNRFKVLLKEQRFQKACADARFLLEIQRKVDIAMNLASLFASNHMHFDALSALDFAAARLESDGLDLKFSKDWYRSEIERLREVITADINDAQTRTISRQCRLGQPE